MPSQFYKRISKKTVFEDDWKMSTSNGLSILLHGVWKSQKNFHFTFDLNFWLHFNYFYPLKWECEFKGFEFSLIFSLNYSKIIIKLSKKYFSSFSNRAYWKSWSFWYSISRNSSFVSNFTQHKFFVHRSSVFFISIFLNWTTKNVIF